MLIVALFRYGASQVASRRPAASACGTLFAAAVTDRLVLSTFSRSAAAWAVDTG